MRTLRATIFFDRAGRQFLAFIISSLITALGMPALLESSSSLGVVLFTGITFMALSIYPASFMKKEISKYLISFYVLAFPMSRKMGFWFGLKRVMGAFLGIYIAPTVLALCLLIQGKLSIVALNMCLLHWLLLILAFRAEVLHHLFFPAKLLIGDRILHFGYILIILCGAIVTASLNDFIRSFEAMGDLGIVITFFISFLSGMLYFSRQYPQYSILFTIALTGVLVPFLVLFVRDLLKPEDAACTEDFERAQMEGDLDVWETTQLEDMETATSDDSDPQDDHEEETVVDDLSHHPLPFTDHPEYDAQSTPELQVLNYIRKREGTHDLRRPPVERNYYKPLGLAVVFGLAAYALYPHFAPSPKSPLLLLLLFFRSAFSGQLIASPVGVPLRWIPIIRRIFWDDLKAYGVFDLLYCLICSDAMTQGFALTPLFFIASCFLRLTSYIHVIAADMDAGGWKAPRDLLNTCLIGFVLILGMLYGSIAFERDFLDRISHYLMQLTISFFVLVAVQSTLAMTVLFAIQWKTRLNVMNSSYNPFSRHLDVG